MDQRPYSAASMIQGTGTRPTSIDTDGDEFNTLPESPFTKNQEYSPFGLDSLPHDGIFSSMHGLNLGATSGGFMDEHSHSSHADTGDSDDASFLDLPFACNDMDEESYGLDNNLASSSSLPVSSFVSLVESAPKLSLFESNGASEEDQVGGMSIDDELREFQLFGQALRS